MKRTIVEVFCGLAVAVLLVSFHQQITRLRAERVDVNEIRDLAESTAASATSRGEMSRVRREIVALLDDRLRELAAKVETTEKKAEEASCLRDEIDAARRESDLLKAEISRDVSRTRELVNAFHQQFATQERSARDERSQTRRLLESLSGKVSVDRGLLRSEMLSPTVQLNGEDTVGSGTMVYSALNEQGEGESYVLTSYHVVRNIFSDSPRAKREGIDITIYGDSDNTDVKADMICHEEDIDAALLKLRSTEVFPNVARIATREDAAAMEVWEPVYAIGCPLGNDPIPTSGELSSKDNVLSGTNYWMINAPTYYGNSGGGVFGAERRDLVGVFSKIYTHGRTNPVVVPHMGLCTPIGAIYDWLGDNDYGYVLEHAGVAAVAAPGK